MWVIICGTILSVTATPFTNARLSPLDYANVPPESMFHEKSSTVDFENSAKTFKSTEKAEVSYEVDKRIDDGAYEVDKRISDASFEVGKRIDDGAYGEDKRISDASIEVGKRIEDGAYGVDKRISDASFEVGKRISDASYDVDKKISDSNIQKPCAIVVLSNMQNPNTHSLLRKYRYDSNGVLIPGSVKYFVKLPNSEPSSPVLVPIHDRAFSPLGGFVRYYKEVPPIPQSW